MAKREIRIKGLATTEIKNGEPALLLLCNGDWIKTSPVVFNSIHGGVVYVETRNSIYCNV